MRSLARLCTLVVAFLALSGAATADNWVVFTKDEVAVIQGYYAQHPVDSSKGGQKGQKSKPLPPGITKQQLPQDLVRQLPPDHSGYERVYVDGRVLLVDIATQVIHEVLMEAVYD